MSALDWITHHAPVIGLLFFVIFFTAAAIWVYRPGSKKEYQNFASIPFEEDKDE